MQYSQIPPFTEKGLNVIIETPRGSQSKYDYDPRLDIFKVKKSLPMGMAFPFDFGFVPNTLAADGDPLDVIILMDPASYPGCLVHCTLIGALEVLQTERDGRELRNDRLVAVADYCMAYTGYESIDDLNKAQRSEIEKFFISYNEQQGKKFKPLKWVDAKAATQLVHDTII